MFHRAPRPLTPRARLHFRSLLDLLESYLRESHETRSRLLFHEIPWLPRRASLRRRAIILCHPAEYRRTYRHPPIRPRQRQLRTSRRRFLLRRPEAEERPITDF